jgi:hypothetical protein
MRLSETDKAEANHLTKQILAYDLLIDEADTLDEAARLEAEQDRLRATRNRIIWRK